MDGFGQAVKQINSRNNPIIPNIVIATVISLLPFRVRLNNEVILESRHLYMSSGLLQRTLDVTIPDILENPTRDFVGVIEVEPNLKVGDLVSVLPMPDIKKYYIIDKVVKL